MTRKSLEKHSCLRTRLGDWGGNLFPLHSVSYSLSTKLITVTQAYYHIIPSCFSPTGWLPAKHLTMHRQYRLLTCISKYLATCNDLVPQGDKASVFMYRSVQYIHNTIKAHVTNPESWTLAVRHTAGHGIYHSLETLGIHNREPRSLQPTIEHAVNSFNPVHNLTT